MPLLTFTGVEGKMFQPMALTVIFALAAAFVLSLTFVPAMIAIVVTGRVQEERERGRRGAEARLRAAADAGDRPRRCQSIVGAVGALRRRACCCS